MIGFAPGGITSGGFLLVKQIRPLRGASTRPFCFYSGRKKIFNGFLIGNRCDIMGSYGKAGCGKWDRESRMEEL